MKSVKRHLPALIAALGWMGAMLPSGSSAKDVTVNFDSYPAWPDEVKDTFREWLVQEGGRVKPVHTYSRFMLMQFSGRSKVKFETKDGKTHEIEAVEWLLDSLFRPQLAAEIPIFIVDDSETVTRLGVGAKEKRDRYSYNDLLDGRAKLADLAAEYGRKKQQYEESEKDPQFAPDRIERMIIVLGQNVSNFEYLMGQFGFARKGQSLTHEAVLPPELKELAKRLDMTEMLDKMPEMSVNQLIQAIQTPSGAGDDQEMLRSAMQLFFFHASSGRGFAIFPPPDLTGSEHEGHNHGGLDPEVWLSIGDVMLTGLESKEFRPWVIERMNEMKGLVEASSQDGDAFATALKAFADQRRSEADARGRGEGDRSSMEVGLYRGDYFYNALVWSVLGFVLLTFTWLAPGSQFSKYLTWGVVACLVIGLLYNTVGITLRCLIRHRPPITNLYDTVIFITAVAMLLGLLLEWFTRIGVGVFVSALSGAIGMFLSIKYEAREATDTMGQLVAVLDTNFWLATHVTIINIGYAAGMASALLGSFYLLGRLVIQIIGYEFPTGPGRLLMVLAIVLFLPILFWPFLIWMCVRAQSSRDVFRGISRMNYGII
ncbi:MAG: hypothetical protein KDL87_01030, partial [Verrucomicrobiae bacterium]|nr:hypothetical protein [Verrucomicrobiae bacterium]